MSADEKPSMLNRYLVTFISCAAFLSPVSIAALACGGFIDWTLAVAAPLFGLTGVFFHALADVLSGGKRNMMNVAHLGALCALGMLLFGCWAGVLATFGWLT